MKENISPQTHSAHTTTVHIQQTVTPAAHMAPLYVCTHTIVNIIPIIQYWATQTIGHVTRSGESANHKWSPSKRTTFMKVVGLPIGNKKGVNEKTINIIYVYTNSATVYIHTSLFPIVHSNKMHTAAYALCIVPYIHYMLYNTQVLYICVVMYSPSMGQLVLYPSSYHSIISTV